jgi:hypothetical protein
MDDLKRYVDRLFAGYKETEEVRELKAEILSNLEARVADYTGEGMSYGEAVVRAKENLGAIDFLIPHQKPVQINRYKAELLQAALLYTIIAWVLTIPLRVIPSGVVANTLLLFMVAGLGLSYLILFCRKYEIDLDAAAPLDQERIGRHGRAAWLLWALFIILAAVLTTLKYFGSDIWFGRPLHLDGPYRFAQIAVSYILPFITVVLPLLYRKARTLAEKYEVER